MWHCDPFIRVVLTATYVGTLTSNLAVLPVCTTIWEAGTHGLCGTTILIGLKRGYTPNSKSPIWCRPVHWCFRGCLFFSEHFLCLPVAIPAILLHIFWTYISLSRDQYLTIQGPIFHHPGPISCHPGTNISPSWDQYQSTSPQMARYWSRMVRYRSLDGKILVPGWWDIGPKYVQ